MTSRNSSISLKPAKPYLDYPLFAHSNGQWAKKSHGKLFYFGPWADHHAALLRYLAVEADVKAGRSPKPPEPERDELTIEQMVVLFLNAKKIKVASGELAPATWKEYESYGKRMMTVLGKDTPVNTLGPTHFQKLREHFQRTHKTLVSIKSDIRKIMVFFNWAGSGPKGQGLIETLPRFGDAFVPPSRDALARERESKPEAVFEAAEIRAMLALARPNLKAIILLGVNCGLGNTDCARFMTGKFNLVTGWATFPRTKNANPRRCPLWPETVEAIREAMKVRPAPRDPKWAKIVFITHHGQPFTAGNLGHEFDKLAIKAGLPTKPVVPRKTKKPRTSKRKHKPGKIRLAGVRAVGDFYDLRRTCISVGIQLSDDDAMRAISGHKREASDMLGVYNRMKVEDERILRVSNHVRQWLFTDSAIPSEFQSGS